MQNGLLFFLSLGSIRSVHLTLLATMLLAWFFKDSVQNNSNNPQMFHRPDRLILLAHTVCEVCKQYCQDALVTRGLALCARRYLLRRKV